MMIYTRSDCIELDLISKVNMGILMAPKTKFEKLN